jgi:hypothetical protein
MSQVKIVDVNQILFMFCYVKYQVSFTIWTEMKFALQLSEGAPTANLNEIRRVVHDERRLQFLVGSQIISIFFLKIGG